MIGVLEGGIEMAHQGKLSFSAAIYGKVITPLTASPAIDPKLRLENFLAQIVSIIHGHILNHPIIWRIV
jgi:hypothetical protein